MALNSIAVEFERFWAMISKGMKGPIPENQRDEMRKAFFAGAWTVQRAMEEIGTPGVPEAAGVAYFETVARDCKAFAAGLLREHAEKN